MGKSATTFPGDAMRVAIASVGGPCGATRANLGDSNKSRWLTGPVLHRRSSHTAQVTLAIDRTALVQRSLRLPGTGTAPRSAGFWRLAPSVAPLPPALGCWPG